jgi:hypothetical protein
MRDPSAAVSLAHGEQAGEGEAGGSCGDTLVFGKAEDLVAFLRVLLVLEEERVEGEFPAGRMVDMVAEVGIPAMAAGEKFGVVRNVFHAIGGGGEDFGEKRVVMDAFVVASFGAAVADANKRGDLPPGVMDAGEGLVVVLKKEEHEFVMEAEKAGPHGGELQDRAMAMAREALLEIVPEAFSLPCIPGEFV